MPCVTSTPITFWLVAACLYVVHAASISRIQTGQPCRLGKKISKQCVRLSRSPGHSLLPLSPIPCHHRHHATPSQAASSSIDHRCRHTSPLSTPVAALPSSSSTIVRLGHRCALIGRFPFPRLPWSPSPSSASVPAGTPLFLAAPLVISSSWLYM